MDLLRGVCLIALIVGAFFCLFWVGFIFPIKTMESLKKEHGVSIISIFWAVFQAIVSVSLFYEAVINKGEDIIPMILIFLAVFVLAVLRCFQKAKALGLNRKKVIIICIAQCCFALGIAIFIISMLGAAGSDKEKNKNSFFD